MTNHGYVLLEGGSRCVAHHTSRAFWPESSARIAAHMAAATEASVFLGTLVGILHLFRIFPAQYNTKVILHALLAALTGLLLFAPLASRPFRMLATGALALLR